MIKLAIATLSDLDSAIQAEIPCQWLDSGKTFKHERRKKEYVLGRYLLYRLLPDNNYPDICIHENGRPFFKDSHMQFNISHSHDMVACAIADSAIGIDIQYNKTKNNFLEIADRFFTQDEVVWLKQQQDIASAFNQLWVIKEAVLKADGGGISSGLQKINIQLKNNLAAQNQLELSGAIAVTSYHHFNIALCQLCPKQMDIDSFLLANNKLQALKPSWLRGPLSASVS